MSQLVNRMNNTPSLPVETSIIAGKTAPLQEIFSSIQGEGIYVGKRQVFVRFAHCHLKCAYCDTPMTSSNGQCNVEIKPGSGEMTDYPNPLQPNDLIGIIQGLLPQAKHHSVSFTGGEPLLYHQFLKAVFPAIQAVSKTYLETSGTQPQFLESVLPWTDVIAMDIKLPSSTGEAPQFDNHARFYTVTQQNPATECFIKLIFNEKTSLQELEAVRAIVTNRETPIILQPETSLADRKVYIRPAKVFEVENYLAAHFSDVRVIPQTHKMLNVL